MTEKLLRFLAEGKLLVTLVSQIAAFLLVWNAKIPPDAYVTLALSVPVAFITGTVLENKISSVTLNKNN
jgi:hypothetical protein